MSFSEGATVSVAELEDQGVSKERAAAISKSFAALICTTSFAPEAWRKISKHVLQPDDPFPAHQLLFRKVYRDWDSEKLGPPPVWIPTPQGMADTNLACFMQSFQGPPEWRRERSGDPARDLHLLHRISYEFPEHFWPPMMEQLRVRFRIPPTRVLEDASNPDEARWLPGARMNIAESALSVRDPDPPALLWAEENSPCQVHSLSLGRLRDMCYRTAAALRAAGFSPGDAIAINMPMTVEACVAYFGIVLAGCTVVSIADSFAPSEISSRLRIVNAKAIVTQDVIIRGGKQHPLYKRVVEAQAPMAIVIPCLTGGPLQEPLRPGDFSWDDFLAQVPELASFEPHVADPYEVTNILFSSGTTGEPKAIPWTHVTPIRGVFAWPTNLGWMMGPFLLYGALLNGAAIALYQGSPLEKGFGEFLGAARVTSLGLVPSIVKAWRASGCMQGLDWGAVRSIGSTGEASAPRGLPLAVCQGQATNQFWSIAGVPKFGGGFLGGSLLQPNCCSTFSLPTLGDPTSSFPIAVAGGVDGGGGRHEAEPHGDVREALGELALAPPILGGSQRLLNRDHYKVYYEGMPQEEGTGRQLRRHGDEMQRLPNGYYVALGRVDDTMNLGGIKVSSVELERVCQKWVEEVREVAAVGVPSPGGGPDRLVLFVVPTGPEADPLKLRASCQQAIRAHLNPLFKVDQVLLRDSLPRTASNKVMRRLLRDELRQTKPRL
eukprot:jgi/Botrbrau1/12623/Bobra.0169s0150.1